jgi:subtilase family serine protease
VAALQGQSMFAAAGDSGAFDLSGELPSGFNLPLSVDYPAADTAITAAGGTTLPRHPEFGNIQGHLFHHGSNGARLGLGLF